MTDYPLMHSGGFYVDKFPKGAVIHLTAGNETIGRQSVQYAIDQKHSYFIIDLMGDVYQQFDIRKWGSHAGKSSHHTLGKNLSRQLVGIEIQNPGKLIKKDLFSPVSWFGKRYEDAEYFDHQKNIQQGWYQRINNNQMYSLQKLLIELKHMRPEVFNLDYVLGHDEVAKERKTDPGGALGMPMDDLRYKLKNLYMEYTEDSYPIL